MALGLADVDLDLCCSESSADFSPDSTDSSCVSSEIDCTAEYRVFSAAEARSELQWLLESEERRPMSCCPADTYACASDLRLLLVDTLCNAAERMRICFATKALAISYLDRVLAARPGQSLDLLALMSMACLSIAAKADEGCLPAHMLMTQFAAHWGLNAKPGDLREVELMVLSALGWQVQDTTAATVLDTLVCLLGYQHSSASQLGCYKQMHTIRESSKLLLAKAFRDPQFTRFRPSSLATAVLILLLEAVDELETDLSNFRTAITELYSHLQSQEVVQCMLLLKSCFSIELIASLQRCRIEVANEEGLVRVYQPQEDSITTTPQSVLHSAQALSYETVHTARSDYCFPAKPC